MTPGVKRVFISVINDLATDQRVGRVSDLLMDQGMEVTCIGRRLRSSPDLDHVRFQSKRFRMIFTKGPLFYACFNMRLLLTLLFVKRPGLFIANDLDTLPATFTASRIRRVELIYDSHELFTQVPELLHRKRIQGIWKWIEHRYVPRVKHAVTVSFPIATIYRRMYGTRFSVVRNMPSRRDARMYDPAWKETHYRGKQLIIYQGALNMGRGLEMMIETMQFLDHAVFIVAGTGDIERELRAMVLKLDLMEKVHFMGRLLPDQLLPVTMSCDLGVSLEEDLGLNYRYALPNKLFDYIQCRVPVLTSDLPEMKRIVQTYGVGVATPERDPRKLAGIIRYMLTERTRGAWRDALDLAAEELCWENESTVYLDLIDQCRNL